MTNHRLTMHYRQAAIAKGRAIVHSETTHELRCDPCAVWELIQASPNEAENGYQARLAVARHNRSEKHKANQEKWLASRGK